MVIETTRLFGRPSTSLAFASLAAFALWGCLSDPAEPDPKGPDRENAGRVIRADGEPAAGAQIRLYPVDNIPPSPSLGLTGGTTAPAYAILADDEGYYRVDSIKSGPYNIFISLEGDLAFRDSVWIYADGKGASSDTLGASSSIEGLLALEPQHDARKVAVVVLGSGLAAAVDGAGRFKLEGLAQGEYTLRFVSSIVEYLPLELPVRTEAGGKTVLKDSIRLPYTDIPVIRGLRAAYDTAKGVVSLRWASADYARLRDYQVFRSLASSSDAPEAVGSTGDTTFRDTLPTDPEHPFGDASTRVWNYTVRVRSLTGDSGPALAPLTVRAVSRIWVRTTIGFEAGLMGRQGLAWDTLSLSADTVYAQMLTFVTVSVHDTVRLVASFGNRTRRIGELTWSLRSGPGTLRRAQAVSDSGTDTLVFVAPAKIGTDTIRFTARDDAGQDWKADLAVMTILDAPMAFAGMDTEVFVGDTLRLSGTASDRNGTVAKIEWDVGATGNFQEAPGGKIIVKAPETPMEAFRCVLRATDDDGLTAMDTLRARVVPFKTLASSQSWRAAHHLEAVGGKLYALGSKYRDVAPLVEEYDAATNSWKNKTRMPTNRMGFGIAAVAGQIYAMGGTYIPPPNEYWWNPRKSNVMEAYDPSADRWTALASMPSELEAIIPFAYKGKVYVFGKEWSGTNHYPRLFEYDPEGNSWRVLPAPALNPTSVVLVDGRIFCIRQENHKANLYEYDIEANLFINREPLSGRGDGYRVVVLDGKIHLLGGKSNVVNDFVNRVDMYDPAKNAWSARSGLNRGRNEHAATVMNGNIYLHGGYQSQSFGSSQSYLQLDCYRPF